MPAASAVPEALLPPTGNPRFPHLDVVRGCAALSVVLYHATQFSGIGPVADLLRHADIGVTVFFVLSGFLLYRPMIVHRLGQAPQVPIVVFYWRRFLRIVPGYWVALVVLAPLITFVGYGVPNFGFLQIYYPGGTLSGIPPAWSVCVELSFYLLLPLYAAIIRRFLGTTRRPELVILFGLALLSICYRVAVGSIADSSNWLLLLPGTLAWFTIGMALALISTNQSSALIKSIAAHPRLCWLLAAALYAAVTASKSQGSIGPTHQYVLYGLIAGLVVAPATIVRQAQPCGRAFASLSWLGLVSYGIYLYHYPVMRHISNHTELSGTGGYALLIAVSVASAVACGSASYYIVERPVLKLKRMNQLRLRPKPESA